jgi:multimeric flavodoxin WrbA
MTKKATSFMGSPHGMNGSTGVILKPFLAGLAEAGCEVVSFDLSELRINPCRGDLSCWLSTDGNCIQDDDMIKVLEAVTDTDIFVMATPLYVDGMTGLLKNLIDRMVPLVLPFIEYDENRMWHPWRAEKRPVHIVLVSTCGFWKLSNFDPLVTHFKAISANFGAEFVGALLRPHAPAMFEMQRTGVGIDDILSAAKQAGIELVKTGKISRTSLETISRPLVEREFYVDRLNEYFRFTIEKKDKKN